MKEFSMTKVKASVLIAVSKQSSNNIFSSITMHKIRACCYSTALMAVFDLSLIFSNFLSLCLHNFEAYCFSITFHDLH